MKLTEYQVNELRAIQQHFYNFVVSDNSPCAAGVDCEFCPCSNAAGFCIAEELCNNIQFYIDFEG